MTRLLHLSDTHVSATGADEDGVHAVRSLVQVLHDARHVIDLDAVVVSGDIADDGSAAGCGVVRDHVRQFAGERGIPHFYTPGNHDRREGFVEALGSGHLNSDGSQRGTLLDPVLETRAAVSHLGDVRIVTLDSLVPSKTHGHVDHKQLTWLAGLLAEPTPAGTVLVLHHPPLSVPSLPYVDKVVLQNPDELADVIRGRDVRVILTGHLHFQVSGSLAGVPIVVTPGVVTRIDTSAPPHLLRGVLGASASVVEFGPSGPVSSYLLVARDPRANEQVYLVDASSGQVATEPA